MSVLTEALHRANARKESLWEGTTAHLDDAGLCLMLSGADLDPADLAGYIDATSAAFLIQWAMGEDVEQVVQGILVEGLLMGLMIDRVYHDRVRLGAVRPPEPSITETAKALASQVMVRAQQLLGRNV